METQVNPDLYTYSLTKLAAGGYDHIAIAGKMIDRFAVARKPITPPVAVTPMRRKSRVGWIALALLVGACATVPAVVTDHGPELRAPVAKLKHDLPIESAPKIIQSDVAAIDASIDTFVLSDDQTQADLIAAKKALADEQARFFSYRQRRAWYWFIGLGSLFLIGIAATSFFSGGATGAAAFGVIGHIISGIFTGGLHFFQLIFQKIGAAFNHPATIQRNLVIAQTKAALANPIPAGVK